MSAWLAFSLAALALWSLWGFLPKLATAYLSPSSILIYEMIGSILVGVLVLSSLDFRLEFHPKGMLYGVLTGMAGLLGSLAFLFAVREGQLAVVVTLTALYPVVVIALSFFLLDEPITLKQGISIFLASVAILLVAL